MFLYEKQIFLRKFAFPIHKLRRTNSPTIDNQFSQIWRVSIFNHIWPSFSKFKLRATFYINSSWNKFSQNCIKNLYDIRSHVEELGSDLEYLMKFRQLVLKFSYYKGLIKVFDNFTHLPVKKIKKSAWISQIFLLFTQYICRLYYMVDPNCISDALKKNSDGHWLLILTKT